MEDRSKFLLNATDGVIEIEGHSDFVAKQILELKELIEIFANRSHHERITSVKVDHALSSTAPDLEKHSAETVVHTIDHDAPQQPPSARSDLSQAQTIEGYPYTFAEMGGLLKIVCEIKGASNRAAMRSAALIYGFGAHLMGKAVFEAEDVRQVCIEHGVLDASNFTTAYDDKKLFIVDGVKGGKKTLKLTVAGLKAAKAIVQGIEADAA